MRRESVVLSLESNIPGVAARDAAAIELLNQRVNSLSKNAVQSRRASREMGDGFDDAGRKARTAGDGVDDLGKRSQKASAEIDRLSGRMRMAADAAALLGPALAPIGAVGAAGMAGLAQQFGFAALAGGTAVAAFQDVGEALKAMNKAGLEPTAANIQAAQIAMEQISPAAQDFVRQLQQMTPQLERLRDTAAAGMFPGMSEGLDALVTRMPDVQRIVGAVAGELGDIAESSGESLASARWDDFFAFLEAEAPKALGDMAAATGNVTHALAELWMATGPLNSDFSSWMVDATRNLDEWATGLSKTDAFAEFIDYVRTNGPQVADTMGALGNAVLQIVEAAAPLGGPVLKGLEAVADVIAAVADSDLGTPIFTALAALSLYNRTLQATAALSKGAFNTTGLTAGIQKRTAPLAAIRSDYRAARASQASMRETTSGMASVPLLKQGTVESERLRGSLRGMGVEAGRAGALVGGLALASTGAADSLGLTNTISLGLMGSVFPGFGTAIGATAGLMIDLSHGADDAEASLSRLNLAAGSGDFEGMNKSLREFNAQLRDAKTTSGVGDVFGDAKADIGAWFNGQRSARAQAEANAATARGAINGASAAAAGIGLTQLAKGFGVTAAGAKSASQSVTEFRNSVIAANEAISGQNSLDSYRSSLIDAREAAEKAGRTLKANGDIFQNQGRAVKRSGLESRAALRSVASGAIEFAGSMKNAERRTKFLDNARGDFIKLARSMGVGRAAAASMADGFGLTDKGAKRSTQSVGDLRAQINRLKGKIVDVKDKGAKESSPRVQALRAQIAALRSKEVAIRLNGANEATAAAARVRAAIAAVQSKSVTITTIVARRASGDNNIAVRRAGGGAVYASGVQSRGPRDDSIPAFLSHREYVQPVSSVDFYGERFMEDVRNRRLPKPQGYADGGSVQRFASGGTARRRRGGKSKSRASYSPGQRAALARFTDALKESTAAIDREKSARDAITQKRSELASTVSDSFKTDLFAGGSVWDAGGGNPVGILKADIAKANAFKATLASLAKAGLDGDALAAVASTGDIGKAQALASGGKAGVAQFETLYRQRAAAAGGVGAYAGVAAYGAEQAAANKELVAMNAQIRHLNAQIAGLRRDASHHAKNHGKETAKALDHSAAKGKRNQKGGRRG